MAAFAVLLASCSAKTSLIAGGEPKTGKNLAAWYGCGSCHEIPGLRGAVGRVAPPLHRIARRAYITGSIPNTPANLMRWIREPQKVDARTIMPDMNISEQQSRDIAAYLYTLD
jgi:cytochrome c